MAEEETDDGSDDEDCIFNIKNDLKTVEPLLMTAKSPAQFVYPEQDDPVTIYVDEEDHLRLVCNDESIFVTCRDKLFWIDGTNRKFKMKKFYCWDPKYNHIIRTVKSGSYNRT